MSIISNRVILIYTNKAFPVQNGYHLILVDANVPVPAGSPNSLVRNYRASLFTGLPKFTLGL